MMELIGYIAPNVTYAPHNAGVVHASVTAAQLAAQHSGTGGFGPSMALIAMAVILVVVIVVSYTTRRSHGTLRISGKKSRKQ
jgi:hypothetical protein